MTIYSSCEYPDWWYGIYFEILHNRREKKCWRKMVRNLEVFTILKNVQGHFSIYRSHRTAENISGK
jgi:hypothetical protein